MGEKPLGIDEAPARMGTIVGGAPLGGVDVPPPAMAAGSINTTRSNIKNSGGVAEAAYDTPDGDELDPMAMKADVVNTTRSNIKSSGSAKAASPPPKEFEPTPTRPGDPFPDKPGPAGMAMKDRRIKGGDAATGAEGVGQTTEPVAMEGEPIPGADVKLGKNPGGAASAAAPDAEVYDTPDGDELDPMAGAATINTTRSNIKNGGSVTDAGPDETIGGAGPAGMAAGSISTTRSNIKNGGAAAETGAGSGEVGVDAAPAGGAPGVAEGVGKPISGVDIIIKKNPPS